MGYRPISQDLRSRALSLWADGWVTEDIEDALCVSKSSLYRWRAKDDAPQHEELPPRPQGRPRKLSPLALDAVLAHLQHHPWAYLGELQQLLYDQFGVQITEPTLSRNIAQADFTRKLLRKKALQQNPAAADMFRWMQREVSWLRLPREQTTQHGCCYRWEQRRLSVCERAVTVRGQLWLSMLTSKLNRCRHWRLLNCCGWRRLLQTIGPCHCHLARWGTSGRVAWGEKFRFRYCGENAG